MDVVGTEIGQKMRSAIKAKLTELGCYVDDELPDYVMVMVANKRTRVQMEEDLQLFLGDNTELFVNWLHQVLKKLQEVTVAPLKGETEKSKEKVKEKKPKEKKDKEKVKLKKIDTVKKAKKKDREKEKLRKKEEKKLHKSKKKSKHHEMIRPNIPPLLMNIEKESEPSITDVFAGQILKNHGITLDLSKEDKVVDKKPILQETKRPILPIIDPATISSQPEAEDLSIITEERPNVSLAAPRDEQIKEITEIEAKIQGLKQKLAEQLDSMSDDEDFLNIRTEAEELMNDFAEDVFQEISSQAPPVETLPPKKKTPPPPSPPKISFPKEDSIELPKELPPQQKPPEAIELPQIELNLPKRPIRERLGTREEARKPEGSAKKLLEVSTAIRVPESSKEKENKRTESPERYTPDRDPFWGKLKSAKSRLGDAPDSTTKKRNKSESDDSEKSNSGSKIPTSNVAGAGAGLPVRRGCVSVVSVRPRPRAAAPNLLLRAVADAHKSLLNIPPKVDVDQQKIKRALVLPMRRCVDAQKIVIQVPRDRQTDSDLRLDLDSDDKLKMDLDKDEYIPTPITKKINNTDYVPSRRLERTTSRRDDTLIVETINIHNTTVDKDKNTQFIVTMDGFNPNAFLAKKLKTEGLLDEEIEEKPKESKALLKGSSSTLNTQGVQNVENVKAVEKNIEKAIAEKIDASQVIVEKEPEIAKEIVIEKAKDAVKQKAKDAVKVNTKDNAKDAAKDSEIEKEVVTEKVVPAEATSQKKRLSDTSDDSDTQVIIKPGADKLEKRKNEEVAHEDKIVEETIPTKKRKASPIVFDMAKKDVEVKRERTESVGSDNHVTVTTTTNTHKYDTLPSLPSERKIVWCRSFPLCRWGSACAFSHPRCKFAAACTRRGCVYDHSKLAVSAPPANVAPVVASHVVPAANYKTISSTLPSVCKYYPNCVNPACHFYHPKPCRYGKACANKLECNFYHSDVPSKWRHTV